MDAATYFVSPAGKSNGDATQSKPLDIRTLQEKVNLKPGDEVVLLDGVYSVEDVLARKQPPAKSEAVLRASFIQGSPGEPIVFRAANRHQAILDGGAPVTAWHKTPDVAAPVYHCTLPYQPLGLLVNGESMATGHSRHADSLDKMTPGSSFFQQHENGRFTLHVRTWNDQPPREAFACCLDVVLDANFPGDEGRVVFEGLVVRRGQQGIGLGERATIRDCIIRDMANQGIAGGRRGAIVEDCVIYNIGDTGNHHGIYCSGHSEDVILRRNIWWRIAGGALHIYSGGVGVDLPARIHVEYNLIGPDKAYLGIRGGTGIYLYGGSRWAGHHRVVRNIVIGSHERALSIKNSHFNLVANNVFLETSSDTVQIYDGISHLVVNNIIESSRGGYLKGDSGPTTRFMHNLLLPKYAGWTDPGRHYTSRDTNSHTGKDLDPFVDRGNFDFRLKSDSEAIDMGIPLPLVTTAYKGTAPDTGVLEFGEHMYGAEGKFPRLPGWLLKEWPLGRSQLEIRATKTPTD